MSDRREAVKELMLKYFGPASAQIIDQSKEDDDQIIKKCKEKALAFLGPEKAKEFDNI